MSDASQLVMIMTTTGSREEAEKLAGALVIEGLAACVQLLPITSYFTWKGQVQRDDEVLLLVKTRKALYSRAEERIRALHSYDTPEVIATPITSASRGYRSWLEEVTTAAQEVTGEDASADVALQPGVEGAGGVEGGDHVVLGPPRAEPGPDRP